MGTSVQLPLKTNNITVPWLNGNNSVQYTDLRRHLSKVDEVSKEHRHVLGRVDGELPEGRVVAAALADNVHPLLNFARQDGMQKPLRGWGKKGKALSMRARKQARKGMVEAETLRYFVPAGFS